MDYDMRKTEERIEEIIRNTFNAIQDSFNYQKESSPNLNDPKRQKLSRIVFPRKRKEPIRVSEQELRFIFVEQLNKRIAEGWDVYYSVETPTKDRYSGFKNVKNAQPKQDPQGRSGEFDLVIFNNRLERIALIEFKANNASDHEHLKDFVKLNNPNEGKNLRYFIEIVNSYDDGTLSSLNSKTKDYEFMFRCWSLDKGKDITKDIYKASIKK